MPTNVSIISEVVEATGADEERVEAMFRAAGKEARSNNDE